MTDNIIRSVVRETIGIDPRPVRGPEVAARIARQVMRMETQETLVALYLNARHHLLGEAHVVSIGTLNTVAGHPRDVFREAILRNALGVVILHNHPSGEAQPSDQDIELTARFKLAGELIGIPLVDHIVVTATGHTSIAEVMEIRNLFP